MVHERTATNAARGISASTHARFTGPPGPVFPVTRPAAIVRPPQGHRAVPATTVPPPLAQPYDMFMTLAPGGRPADGRRMRTVAQAGKVGRVVGRERARRFRRR